jgi:hypothetical protein
MTPQQRAYLQFIAEKGKKTQQQTDQYRADMNKVEPKRETSFEEWKAKQPKFAKGGDVEMFSPLNKLAAKIPRTKGTHDEFMTEISKQPGYRAEEVADRKIKPAQGKMTKQQFIEHLNQHPAPLLDEKVLGGEQAVDYSAVAELPVPPGLYVLPTPGQTHKYEIRRNTGGGRLSRGNTIQEALDDAYSGYPEYWNEMNKGDATHYEDYQIPGGKNYREVLMKMPVGHDIDYKKAAEYGYDKEQIDKNENLRANLAERFGSKQPTYKSSHWEDPNVLAHIRMSDREGPKGEKLLHLEELQSDWHQQGRKHGYASDKPESETDKLYRDLVGSEMKMPVPDAPFKKSWHELALKRALKEAVEGGYHGLLVTPGKEQNERYSLAKHVKSVSYEPDLKFLSAEPHEGGRGMWHYDVSPEQLESYVGKDVAKKLMETEPHQFNGNKRHTLSGLDLQVGGEGMKGFYDKIIPDYLNKLGKKHGVKTRHMQIPNPKTGQSITDVLRAENMTENDWQDMNPDQRMAMIDRHDQRAKANTANLHHFPITEEMRQDIKKNGIPMYKKGGGLKLLPTKFKE